MVRIAISIVVMHEPTQTKNKLPTYYTHRDLLCETQSCVVYICIFVGASPNSRLLSWGSQTQT